MNKCKCCGIDTKNPKFCSKSCAGKVNNSLYPKRKKEKYPDCLWCGKEVNRNSTTYCSYKCQQISLYYLFLNKWHLGIEHGRSGQGVSARIRRYLFEKYNNKCQKCGWSEIHSVTGNVPLEIHHIDGDITNNRERNLELLCPNCHSLTDNWGALNINNNGTLA